MTQLPNKRYYGLILFFYLALWGFLAFLLKPELDFLGDMVENYAWGQTWVWGSFKHPPLVGWIVKLWFILFPEQSIWYYLLAYFNSLIGILGIVYLARLLFRHLVLDQENRQLYFPFLLLVLVFALLSAPYTNLAAKFNADTVLLSLWPWTAYAFFAGLYAKNKKQKWCFTLLLGVMAALAILGKYFSLILLLSLFLISLVERDYRSWYMSAYPYIALIVCILILAPHFHWEYEMGFPFQTYLKGKVVQHIQFRRPFVFLLSGFYYFFFSWVLWGWVRYKMAINVSDERLKIRLRPLVLLCALPAWITVMSYFFLRLHLTTHWAIPVWFSLPILMGISLAKCWQKVRGIQIWNWLKYYWVLVLAGGMAYTTWLSLNGQPQYTYARAHMTDAIEASFQKTYPNQTLSWVGGGWNEAAGIAFFSSTHPHAIPG